MSRPRTTFRARVFRRDREAFTLLEVILAIAILAGSMAALGELLRIAGDNQKDALSLTQAQLLAEAKMVELINAGVVPDPVHEAQLEIITDEGRSYPQWLCNIEIDQLNEPAMVEVSVEVLQDLDPSVYRRARYTIIRWMIDPDALEAMLPEEEE